MVNLSSVILISGIGLAIFFRKDIADFLNSLKGFGTGDVNVNLIPEGAIPEVPPLPESGLAGGLLDVLGGAGTAQSVFVAGQEARIETEKAVGATAEALKVNITDPVLTIFTKPQESILQPVFEAGQVAGSTVFQAGVATQQGLENIDQQIQTQIGEVQLGFQQTQQNIDDFFVGVSESFGSLFGGQSTPKAILTTTTASTPTPTTTDIIEAEQPDLTLVSPFLTNFLSPITTQIFPETEFRQRTVR